MCAARIIAAGIRRFPETAPSGARWPHLRHRDRQLRLRHRRRPGATSSLPGDHDQTFRINPPQESRSLTCQPSHFGASPASRYGGRDYLANVLIRQERDAAQSGEMCNQNNVGRWTLNRGSKVRAFVRPPLNQVLSWKVRSQLASPCYITTRDVTLGEFRMLRDLFRSSSVGLGVLVIVSSPLQVPSTKSICSELAPRST